MESVKQNISEHPAELLQLPVKVVQLKLSSIFRLCDILACWGGGRWRLLQVLYGYALALRLHGGDWGADPASAASVVLVAAPFLGCAGHFIA